MLSRKLKYRLLFSLRMEEKNKMTVICPSKKAEMKFIALDKGKLDI